MVRTTVSPGQLGSADPLPSGTTLSLARETVYKLNNVKSLKMFLEAYSTWRNIYSGNSTAC